MTDSEYIKNELSNNSCSIKIVSKASATDIDTNKVKSILNKSYASAQEMQAISCLFNTMFMSNMEIDNIPLIDPLMDNSVNKWIKHTHVLSKGAYGEVSVADIIQKDIQIIIKIPLDNADYDDILREYFIGITKINSLRYFIPNFVYTLGAFQCGGDIKKGCDANDKANLFIAYEKIPGKGMFYKLQDNGFEWFLNMFAQILIALEIAQREIGFTHYDLHTLNIIIKEQQLDYTGLIDNLSYRVSTKEYPVIIDFGRSCVRYKDKNIGASGLEQMNIFTFCVQGRDVGYFLNSVYTYNDNEKFKNKISRLATHLDIDIFRPSMSFHFNKTPLQILSSMLEKPVYSKIISKTITIQDRQELFPIQYDTLRNTYLNIFKIKSRINNIVLRKCVRNPVIYRSYILSTTVRDLVSKIYEQKESDTVNMYSQMTDRMEDNKEQMIRYDINTLQRYKSIPKIPSEILIISKSLLKQDISTLYAKSYFNPNRKREIISDIKDFNRMYKIFSKILPYLDQGYTIRWYGLEKEYETFLNEFSESMQYSRYIIYKDTVYATLRWVKSLKGDLGL